MPTEPNNNILNRELSRVANKDFIEIASSLLRELVNNGTHVFLRCATSNTGKENEDLAVLFLYLHIIELTDGIEVLISQGAATPAAPLVRSLFEALLSIEYILEDDYSNRSLAWLVDYTHNRLSLYHSLNPDTDKGKEFLRKKAADDSAANLVFPVENAKKAAVNLEGFLMSPTIQPIEDEYRRCKKSRRGAPAWYQLFGGPTSLHDLAAHLHRGVQYEVLYRHWSHIAHANDLSRFIGKSRSGEQVIYGLRNPLLLQEVCSFASSFLLYATRLVLKKFRPEENIKDWYLKEVRERYQFVIQKVSTQRMDR